MSRLISQQYKHIFTPCLMAIALLTRLPVTRFLPEKWSDKALGQSVLWYPFVGLLICLLLTLIFIVLPSSSSPLVVSVLIVIAWVLLTGALHLDGLADSVDAMYAGHAVIAVEDNALVNDDICPKKLTLLRVLKDPNVGAMGAVALILLLLLKVLVLSASAELLMSLLVAVVVSRSMALAFVLSTPYTPYAPSAGLGAVLSANVPKVSAALVLVLVLIVLFFLLPASNVFFLLAIQLVLFYYWRRYWLKQLDGFVGDSIGALIELSEVSLLLTLYFLLL